MAKRRRAGSGDPVGADDGLPRMVWHWVRSRQAEKASRFIGDIAKVDETAALADDVEEIAVFAGRSVGPWPAAPFRIRVR